jgi:adenosylhomocysteine nucleosidase
VSILVLTPIGDELRALESALNEQGLASYSAPAGRLSVRAYYEGKLVLVRGGLGKVQFGLHALHALDNVDDVGAVVCAGVAGGLSDAVSVGDVVVATATIEHDFNWPRGTRPSFEGDADYISALKGRGLPPGSAFRLHFGAIASGDESINDGARAGAS